MSNQEPHYMEYGLSSKMSSELRREVESQLIDDLGYYGLSASTLKFDWSNTCMQGHIANLRNGSVENYSDILVFNSNNQLIAEGWMDFIYEQDYFNEGDFFKVYWDILKIKTGNTWIEKKGEFGIPDHIWTLIPEKIKKFEEDNRVI